MITLSITTADRVIIIRYGSAIKGPDQVMTKVVLSPEAYTPFSPVLKQLLTN